MKIRPFFIIIMICAIFLSSCRNISSNVQVSKDSIDINSFKKIQVGMDKIAVYESGNSIAFLNPVNTSVELSDKISGKIWSTNPFDINQDLIASPLVKNQMNSQFEISYIFNEAIKVVNNYDESVFKKQYEVFVKSNQMLIVYTLGDISKTIDEIPKMISEKRFNQFFVDNKILSTDEIETIKKCYKLDETSRIYSWKKNNYGSYVNDAIKYIEKSGYTIEDFYTDSKENHLDYKISEKSIFKIPILYTFSENNLKVDVPLDMVVYPKNYPIIKLDLLKYMCSGKTDGYLFVPDGSGAVIDYNGNKNPQDLYSAKVYLEDYNIGSNNIAMNKQPVLLPVYASVSKDSAIFAVIENGDGMAYIHAQRAGFNCEYNTINSSFNIVDFDYLKLKNGAGTSKIPMFSSNPYKGNITINYYFLQNEKATISEMASIYRKTLFSDKKKNNGSDDEGIYLNIINGVYGTQNNFGFVNNATVPLTTFKQTKKIIEALKAKEISNLKIELTGWMQGGYNAQVDLSNAHVDNSLGDEKEFKDLIQFSNENSAQIFPSVKVTTVDKLGGMFSKNIFGLSLDQSVERTYKNDTIKNTVVPNSYVVSPFYINNILNNFNKVYSKFKTNTICFEDIGNMYYADYNKSHNVDSQTALMTIQDLIRNQRDKYKSIMVKTANARILPYVDYVLETPMSSSNYNIFDFDVPFYQMVIRGNVKYSGDVLNKSSDINEDLLKCIEYGSNAMFRLTFNEKELKNVSANELNLESSNFLYWIDDIENANKQLAPVLEKINGCEIVKFERLNEDVRMITYSNGVRIIVNYSSNAYNYNNEIIPPKQWKIFA